MFNSYQTRFEIFLDHLKLKYKNKILKLNPRGITVYLYTEKTKKTTSLVFLIIKVQYNFYYWLDLWKLKTINYLYNTSKDSLIILPVEARKKRSFSIKLSIL